MVFLLLKPLVHILLLMHFKCIHETLKQAKFDYVYPYHVQIPSFGDWGFVMASSLKRNIQNPTLNIPTRFLDTNIYKKLFLFEKDIQRTDISVNELDKGILLNYYLNGWRYYSR